MNIWNKVRQYGVRQSIQFALYELKLKWYYPIILNSYSQLQEDLILDKLTGHKEKGVYVDVGAFDPKRFSNTMRFYRRGWRGITIEPNRLYWQRFLSARKHDINLNAGVGQKRGTLTFYAMDPPTISTFQKDQVSVYKKQGFRLVETVAVPVYPLKQIFQKYLRNKTIDFMSIDVEGMEIEVLRSNDWNKYRPRYLCIEFIDFPKSMTGIQSGQKIEVFLRAVKYKRVYGNDLNSFYEDTTL